MLRSLSRRLGEALRMKKYYFLYDASIAVFTISLALILLGVAALPARLLFVAGAALIAGTTVRYWGWIIPEILKRSK
jgi:hypothetical protein